MSIPLPPETDVEYPDSDGQPMSDNTLQFQWIVTIQGNLDGLFADDPNVFVAGDLLWYPVVRHPEVRAAPDTMVAFGRPKGYRGSYKQWEEDGVAPQVVFEIQSPGNRPDELEAKFLFYQRHGAEEYYLYDPDGGTLLGWLRRGNALRPITPMHGWTSPRLGIRFDMSGADLVIYRPDGKPFLTFVELMQQSQEAERQAARAERQVKKAERQAHRERQAREEAERRAAQLADRLRALGIDPDQ